MKPSARNLDQAVSIAAATTIDIAAQTLDRRFHCGEGAARIVLAQALAWQIAELAPHASGRFFTAAVAMERAAQARRVGFKGSDRHYTKAVKAMIAAFETLWTEAESQQAKREGQMN